MIKFNKLTVKNFLSVGNNPVEIVLDSDKATLIVGTNGSGKSSVLIDAMSFGLFGKPYRNINKSQVPNAINKKDVLVEVYFSIGNVNFRIVRGIKPNLFEIYRDGEKIDQSGDVRTDQTYLEKSILRLDHKTFHQVVVLASSSFIPFMQLPAASRRKVIEDLLDIDIFSKMLEIAKDRNKQIQQKENELRNDKRILYSEIKGKEDRLRDIERINNNAKIDFQQQLDEKQNKLDDNNKKVEKIPADIEDRITRKSDEKRLVEMEIGRFKEKEVNYKRNLN